MSTDSVERVWSRDPTVGDAKTGATFYTDPQIALAVYRFSNPVFADIRYWLAQPTHRSDFPAFVSLEHPYDSPTADRSQTVMCATGSVERCQIWFYWPRYGQFIVQTQYVNTEHADAVTFRRYVERIDQHIRATLTGGDE